jgi:hypothetical protein
MPPWSAPGWSGSAHPVRQVARPSALMNHYRTMNSCGGWPRYREKLAHPLKMGAPGASLLGTWETTNPSPFCRRQLAPPQWLGAPSFPRILRKRVGDHETSASDWPHRRLVGDRGPRRQTRDPSGHRPRERGRFFKPSNARQSQHPHRAGLKRTAGGSAALRPRGANPGWLQGFWPPRARHRAHS